MKLSYFLSVCSLSLLLGLSASASAEVSDQQFEQLMNKYLDSNGGKAAVGKAVEGYFLEKQQEARKKQEDQQVAQVENQFKNPVKIDAGNSPAKGPANAKVTVIEFSDFQCPFCKRGKETMDELLKLYPNDVRIVFKNLPLDFHEEAEPAARAALAAGKQGKFWEMHDILFNNQQKLGAEFYLESAKTLGLDADKFQKDMASEETTKSIQADKELAKKHEIQGTPGFFVNGVAVKGAYPINHFKMIVDRHLGKTADKAA